MSIALGAPVRSRLGAYVRSRLGARATTSGSIAGDLFISGSFTAWEGDASINNLGAFNSTTQAWVDANNGINAGITRFALHNGELYCVRNVSNTTTCCYRWNVATGAWVAVGASPLRGGARDLLSYNGELWVCGEGDLNTVAAGTLGQVVKYDGSAWSACGTWFATDSAAIVLGLIQFTHYAGDLIAYGDPTTRQVAYEGTDGGCLLKLWDGSDWQESPEGRPSSDSVYTRVLTATIWRGKLLMSAESSAGNPGSRINVGTGEYGTGALTAWNGETENGFQRVDEDPVLQAGNILNEAPTRMAVHSGTLYVAGALQYTGTVAPAEADKFGGICKVVFQDEVDGSGISGESEDIVIDVSLVSMNGGLRRTTGNASTATDLCSYGAKLVVSSGIAEQAGNTPDTDVNGLYVWNGSTWVAPTGVATGGGVSVVFNAGADLQF